LEIIRFRRLKLSNFDRAFDIVVNQEGGLSMNPKDPGNWTGGKVNVGTLKGTKYGIAAASYPTLDILNLTIDQAKAIYKANYWDRVAGDQLPYEIGLPVFDAAINEGVRQAVLQLQVAAGVSPDGVMGPATLSAVMRIDQDKLLIAFMTQEFNFKTHLKIWLTFGLGWLRRGFTIAIDAIRG
jgi:lysozyme family protein